MRSTAGFSGAVHISSQGPSLPTPTIQSAEDSSNGEQRGEPRIDWSEVRTNDYNGTTWQNPRLSPRSFSVTIEQPSVRSAKASKEISALHSSARKASSMLRLDPNTTVTWTNGCLTLYGEKTHLLLVVEDEISVVLFVSRLRRRCLVWVDQRSRNSAPGVHISP